MYGMRQMAASNRKEMERGDFLKAWDTVFRALVLASKHMIPNELIRGQNDMKFLTDLRVLKKKEWI